MYVLSHFNAYSLVTVVLMDVAEGRLVLSPTCEAPPVADNAVHSGSSDSYAADTAVFYTCNSWYSDGTAGDRRLICTNTGQWVGTMPSCELDSRTGEKTYPNLKKLKISIQ